MIQEKNFTLQYVKERKEKSFSYKPVINSETPPIMIINRIENTVCMQQPLYIPYAGFFHKLVQCDCCVILDDVEYSKNDYFNRNRIKTAQGWLWITVPVMAHSKDLIKDVKISNSNNWKEKHYKTISQNYNKCAYFDDIKELLECIYAQNWNSLLELNMYSLEILTAYLGIKTKFILASGLNINSKRTQRLVDICKKMNYKTYLSGLGAKDYMEDNLFDENNLQLRYQDYRAPVYNQKYGEFIPDLSIIDMIANCGKMSTELIMNISG